MPGGRPQAGGKLKRLQALRPVHRFSEHILWLRAGGGLPLLHWLATDRPNQEACLPISSKEETHATPSKFFPCVAGVAGSKVHALHIRDRQLTPNCR